MVSVGLAAFDSWRPTTQLVLRGNAELVVTDFTEEAANLAHGIVESEMKRLGCSRTLDKVCMNPFRRPLSSQGADNLLPFCSNGFMFRSTGNGAPV